MTEKKPLTREQMKKLTPRQQKNLWDKMAKEALDTIEANPISALVYYTLKAADPHKSPLELQMDTARIVTKAFKVDGTK